jgi:H+/Cl- antiporter ClcA
MRLSEWTSGKREAPEPLEGNVVATVLTGTLVWAALFLVQLPFYGWLSDHDHEWWLWTCLAGVGGGLLGLWYVRRREAAIQAHRARQAQQPQPPEPPPGDGP